jgi:cellulose synthase (UDP-forming)
MAIVCVALGAWYLGWLLQPQRVGVTVLFVVLVAAESFNLLQALGFWWTCSHERVRRPRPPAPADTAVDVLIPTYDEPIDVVEPTVAAAVRLRGAEASVWLLDDGGRAEMAELARRHGARYVARGDRTGAKAGNLNHALTQSSAPYVCVLDCDHVPRPALLERTLGHLAEDRDLAFVQTPQYYANAGRASVSAAAASQQALFFGPIARGKDGLGAMFCCGTNVVFRRAALDSAGGFPEHSVTEDFELSIRLHERGWRSAYEPEVLAVGLGPEDMASYVSQQQRWARGCLSALPAVLRARLPWRLRVQYLLSAGYFLSGWTLLVYMSLPVLRILTGAQPLAATTADQFLLHFAPYYCAALAAVALAGYSTYTFGAFTLAAGSFWIHVQAAVSALLRLPAHFVVTPKRGVRRRQPRAVAPALLALAALLGAAVWGLAHNRSAATLNNVAFAALHASVLAVAVAPALRLRRSPALPPEPESRPAVSARHRRWPIPAAAAALAAALLAASSLAVVGNRTLGLRPNLSEKAHSAAEHFMTRYVERDGRVVRRDQGGDTVSEGQAYAMLLAVALDDRARFASVWGWTQAHLQRHDQLLAYRWAGGRVVGAQAAADADLDAARALVLAGRRFGDGGYTRAGVELSRAVLARETADVAGAPVLVAGAWARTPPPVVNPSYFSPRAYADLDHAGSDSRWPALAATSRALVASTVANGRRLPPDWARVPVGLAAEGIVGPAATASLAPGRSGLDAARVAVRAAESCVAADRRLAAGLWPVYRRAPGLSGYAIDGRGLTGQHHAASFVAAAAAARAAGHRAAGEHLLDRAEATDRAHPTYYGAAWAALGRVLLTSSALGACQGP